MKTEPESRTGKHTAERSESLIRQIQGRCHYYTGTQHETCSAGVNYLEIAGPIDGLALRLPCLEPSLFAAGREKNGYTMVDCPKLNRVTREEAEKIAEEMIGQSEKTMKAAALAHKDAKGKGFKKGNGGRSSLPCPLECGGTLHYSVAGYNGHMHASCSTVGCVSWME